MPDELIGPLVVGCGGMLCEAVPSVMGSSRLVFVGSSLSPLGLTICCPVSCSMGSAGDIVMPSRGSAAKKLRQSPTKYPLMANLAGKRWSVLALVPMRRWHRLAKIIMKI